MKRYVITGAVATSLVFFPAFLSQADMQMQQANGYHINKDFDLVLNDKNSNRKIILLTIDDGPSKYSKDIIAILTQHNAKAIFFINGIRDQKYPGIIEFESRAGFSIGNHTWSHMNLKKESSLDTITEEIRSNSALIAKYTGAFPRFFRPPYGTMTPYIDYIVQNNSMLFMNWSGAALDWERNTWNDERVFIKNVTDTLHPGEILLLHEHSWTVKYLDRLLSILEEKGYSFADPNQITQ